MSYPHIEGTPSISGGQVTSANHTCTVTLPGSIQAGELLMLFLAGAKATFNISNWNGFTQLRVVSSSNVVTSVAYKVADGSEGGSINLTGNNIVTCYWAAIAVRISGYKSTAYIIPSGGATGLSNHPDPDNCAPGAAYHTMWIAVAGVRARVSVIDWSLPDNQVNGQNPSFSYVAINISTDELYVSSLDPNYYGISQSDEWACCTIAVMADPTPTPANKQLHYYDGASIIDIDLYQDTVGMSKYMEMQIDGSITAYAQISSNLSHAKASDLRVRKGTTTYAVLTEFASDG